MFVNFSKSAYRAMKYNWDKQSNVIMEFKVVRYGVLSQCLPADISYRNRKKVDISFDKLTDCLIQELKYQEWFSIPK